ncbi:MetQ/NlpA family ABC transporter substrate-binding protein [Variovorax sp.]|uniref:MetQ/NlpA family ABC transporter substrate-binding protein n=1 Tax=Variovorax sp. TaxID=1871043 RepID=UPI003BAC0874
MRFPLRAPSLARWSASLLGSLALGLFIHVSAQAADLRVGFMRGQIDANIFQHTLYLNATNKQQGFDLVPIVHVPTPPMGLYSQRHKSLDAVPDGATVTLPSDPVNAARALNILAAIGWVTLKPGVSPIAVSERDIAKDIAAAHQSPEFQRFFKANPTWAGYRLPDYFAQ